MTMFPKLATTLSIFLKTKYIYFSTIKMSKCIFDKETQKKVRTETYPKILFYFPPSVHFEVKTIWKVILPIITLILILPKLISLLNIEWNILKRLMHCIHQPFWYTLMEFQFSGRQFSAYSGNMLIPRDSP